ncbi:MAG: hypothetical protein QG672_1841 [Pseudomonadota bacterium]|nr:hypothetical protein [Pseudomonadota bacterium]
MLYPSGRFDSSSSLLASSSNASSASRSAVSSSKNEPICRFGTINVWPSETGKPSRITLPYSFEKMTLATSSAQKGQLNPSIISTLRWFSRNVKDITHRANRKRALTSRSKPFRYYWSGRRDSNSRPLAPHASALPGCATPRRGAEYNRKRGTTQTRSSAIKLKSSARRPCGAGASPEDAFASAGTPSSRRLRAPLMVKPWL